MVIGLAADLAVTRIGIDRLDRWQAAVVVGRGRTSPFPLADDPVLADERLEAGAARAGQEPPHAAVLLERPPAVGAGEPLGAGLHEIGAALRTDEARQPHGSG